MCCTNFENRLTIKKVLKETICIYVCLCQNKYCLDQLKKFCPKTILNRDILYKKYGREVIIFPQNYETRLVTEGEVARLKLV